MCRTRNSAAVWPGSKNQRVFAMHGLGAAALWPAPTTAPPPRRPGPGCSPQRHPQLASEEAEDDLVHPAPLDEHLLAAPALHLEAEPRVGSQSPFIGRVARQTDLVEVEGLEGVTAEQRHRLGAEAASPAVGATDDDA